MTTDLEVSLRATPVSVRQAREKIGEIAASLGASERLIHDMQLCISEAVANVVRHAYGRDGGELRLTVDRAGPELTVVVRDEGVGLGAFQREGDLGYGLRIIEQLTQRCSITSAPSKGTEVRMVFALDADRRDEVSFG